MCTVRKCDMAVRLSYYASKGHLKRVKRCIKDGVDVDACRNSGKTALFHAAQNNREKCVKYLLVCGADPNRYEHQTESLNRCKNCDVLTF